MHDVGEDGADWIGLKADWRGRAGNTEVGAEGCNSQRAAAEGGG